MHKREDHHHTAEQIAGYVAEAVTLCERAILEPGERAVLLPVVVSLLASKQVFYEQAMPLPNLAIPRGNH